MFSEVLTSIDCLSFIRKPYSVRGKKTGTDDAAEVIKWLSWVVVRQEVLH